MGSTARRAAALLLALTLIAGCGGDNSDDGSGGTSAQSSKGPVTLSFWAWAPNIKQVVKRWNDSHPDIQVKVSQPAQGDDLVTKLISANKAGNPPDLAQAEYQALPALLLSDAVADITKRVEPIKGKFSDATWKLVTLNENVYAIPQDTAPMMLLYRKDLFKRFGLEVPKTWQEFDATAAKLRAADSERYLTTFSANDPGWFAGLAQQAGGQWWNIDGKSWKVGIADDATKRVGDYWNGLLTDKKILGEPMYTPQ